MKTTLKKFIILTFIFLNTSFVLSQNVEHKSFLIWLFPGVKDTIMWPLRDSFGAVKWRNHYNPPDNANFSGNYKFTIKKITGNGINSVAILDKPLNEDGDFYVSITTAELDSFWLFQSTAFTDLKFVGDGRIYQTPVIQQHYPAINLAFIIQPDTTGLALGDSALFRIGVTKDK